MIVNRLRKSAALAAMVLGMAAGQALAETLHVALDGNDKWSGKLARPNAQKTDGPLASLAGARDAVRKLKSAGPLKEAVNIIVADGTYALGAPVIFTSQDSGTKDAPITYAAADGAKPLFSGGRVITGFAVQPDGLWTAQLPQVKEGWNFEQLWVDGQRATRARTPNKFYTPHHREGTARLSFDLMIEPGAVLFHEWRDGGSKYKVGPSIWIEGRKLQARGQATVDLPENQWVHVEISAGLGGKANGTWDLTVKLPGGEVKTFKGLKTSKPDWNSIEWLGFCSTAKTSVSFYLDNVELTNDWQP